MNVRDIVLQVVKEYSETKKKEEENQIRLSILLSYPSEDKNVIWAQLKSLPDLYHITLLLSEDWENPPDGIPHHEVILIKQENLTIIQEAIAHSTILLVPNTTFAILAKLALTIDDDLTAWIMIQMQLEGKQIVLTNNQIALTGNRSFTAPVHLRRRIESYISQLHHEGIQFIALEHIQHWFTANLNDERKTQFILAKQMDELVNSGVKELTLSKYRKVSPMGKDRAKELGIRLEYKDE